MVGDLHPLVAEPARRQGHTVWQWDLDPLPERILEPWHHDEHVEVIRVELHIEPPQHESSWLEVASAQPPPSLAPPD
jgi:hypothetical protein